MGSCQSQQQQQQYEYSIIYKEKQPYETHIWRNPLGIQNSLDEKNILSLQDTWFKSVQLYFNNPCLVERNKNGQYEPKTYNEVHQSAQEIGSGIINLNLATIQSEYKNYNLQMVGIFADNGTNWLEVDIGCSYLYGMVTVPIDTGLLYDISHCLKISNMSLVFASSLQVDYLLDTQVTQELANLQYIVAFDEITEEQRTNAKQKNLKIFSLEEVQDAGRKNIRQYKDIKPDDIYTLQYTSGTEDKPNAVMLTNKNFISMFAAINNNKGMQLSQTDVYLSCLPLSHIYDRCICSTMLSVGASIYFHWGATLQQNLQTVKPTIFAQMPYFYTKFYDHIFSQIGLRRAIAESAVYFQFKQFRNNRQFEDSVWNNLFFNQIKQEYFGGRVRYMVTASAPISQDIKDFFQISLQCPMLEVYGLTESSGANFLTAPEDLVSGHVGGTGTNQEFKLVDITEMNYLSTDVDQNGQPAPRGEVCMRGPSVFAGYYKDEEKTKEAIDKDGWLHTGDVGQINAVNGSLKIIDRKKNIFKLAQGYYIAPEYIESIYKLAKGVGECFVYGDSLKSYLVCIVVADKRMIEAYGKMFGLENLSYKELLNNEEIKLQILRNINSIGDRNRLMDLEQVKQIYLESSSFQDLGCMTQSMKLQRHKAKIHFKEILDQLYSQPLN